MSYDGLRLHVAICCGVHDLRIHAVTLSVVLFQQILAESTFK